MIEAARKRVPAWALGIALAAGIGIGVKLPVILDWWRVPVALGLIGADAYLSFVVFGRKGGKRRVKS